VFARTPEPPYVAVIFSSRRSGVDEEGYARTAARMEALAADQPGYLGIESARDPGSGFGITVSYWATEADARAWKREAEHAEAQRLGASRWYERYEVRVATVERAHGHRRELRREPGPSSG
jgi:heme-degrading monooxygenase HmoA